MKFEPQQDTEDSAEVYDDAVYFSCRTIQLKREHSRRRRERQRGLEKKLGTTVEERFLMVFDGF